LLPFSAIVVAPFSVAKLPGPFASTPPAAPPLMMRPNMLAVEMAPP
jgi:hypothetical protein